MEIDLENLEELKALEEYYKELDEALLSFDLDTIRDFVSKYGDAFGIPVPEDDNVLYASAMMSVLELNTATKEQKKQAETWLKENWNKKLH